MNRDESRTRAEEHPPALTTPDGAPPLLCPRDGQRGGTWIGVNGRGLVGCLLNLYDAENPDAPPIPKGVASRGELIPRILAHGELAPARTWLETSFERDRYAPFRLALFSLEGGLSVVWRGYGELEETEHPLGWTFLSSSSWRPDEVLPWRREQFEAWCAAGEPRRGPLPEFHLLQPAEREWWAPLLSRDRTSTRSITQIDVEAATARSTMRYWSRPEPTLDPAVDLDEQVLPIG